MRLNVLTYQYDILGTISGVEVMRRGGGEGGLNVLTYQYDILGTIVGVEVMRMWGLMS